MRKSGYSFLSTPVLGRVVLFLFRGKKSLTYLSKQVWYQIKWLFGSREATNYTYNLEENNKRYLASLISEVLDVEVSSIVSYIDEVEGDKELKQHILDATKGNDFSFMADQEVRFGRRIGWYAIVRAKKPKVVIETGVDKGLGACVLAAALKRNKAEGHAGEYYGTDIDLNAGYLLSGDYSENGRILYGDSIESLSKFDHKIDLFINDSDHSAEYEAEEYKVIAKKLSEDAIILGDNSHVTDKLLNFSLETNRNFVFFQEKPLAHWYPGAGIGISFKRFAR